MRGRGRGAGRAGRGPARDCVSFQGAARPVCAAEEPGGCRPRRPRPRPRPPPPEGPALRGLGAGAAAGAGGAARGPRGRGAAACALSWCRCARSAWATTPTSWCVSASAAAPAAARAPRMTSVWPACWAPGPCGRPPARGPSASPAADPRATRPSPSWTSTAPGGPWTASRPLPAAVWAEGSLRGCADAPLPVGLTAWDRPGALAGDGGFSRVSDGHQPCGDRGTTDKRPQGSHPAGLSPTDPRNLSCGDPRTHCSQTLAVTRPWTQDSSSGKPRCVRSQPQPRPGGTDLETHCNCVAEVPVLERALDSLVGAGPLFITSKLFIYFCGLSDPLLGCGGRMEVTP